MKARVPIAGTVGKSIKFDPLAGARAEAAVAALAAQINAGLGGNIRHSSLQGLQIGDDHPQYTGNAFQETITGQWNFGTIPLIQGATLAEYIEDVVGGSFFDFLQDTTSVVWTYYDTAQELEANVPPEFVQDTVGAMLVDTSTVDFTYDDPTGKISAVVPGAALTKTDDTNVTLTLGGTPATALARAASLALGWTGQLAVSRGGSGAGTLTGYLKGNGTAAFTAVSTIPYSDISGTPTIPVGANPSANIGLSAVNGVATSFMRSDGAPALDQGIAPTWTAQHKFQGSPSRGGVVTEVSMGALAGVYGIVSMTSGAAGTDKKSTEFFQEPGGDWTVSTNNEASSDGREIFRAVRGTGIAVSAIKLGNTTDNPPYEFRGTGNVQFGGTGTGAQTATFVATNKPGAGAAGVISWIPVLTAGGTQGYVPVFGA